MDTDTELKQPSPEPPKSRRNWWIIAGAAVIVIVGVVLALQFSSTATAETADVAGQGGAGVWALDGVTLSRSADGYEVSMEIPRPQPGTYNYPLPETPGGDWHPPVGIGEEEVYTLWLFNFNHPELCQDPYVCRNVDITRTDEATQPALGGIYQVDGVIVSGDIIKMSGEVLVGTPALVGADLTNPLCSHVHVAAAPHGKALDGDDLLFQLNNGIGSPDWWWAATFEWVDPEKGCTPQPS